LAEIRGSSSAPIANAPMAVGVSTNPEESGRPIQDACIAAYHLTLAAHLNGLGTCWIGDMNREAVKDLLNIPVGHYLATVMPMGYPAEWPDTKERRQARAFVRFIG
jgi:nitroreductase